MNLKLLREYYKLLSKYHCKWFMNYTSHCCSCNCDEELELKKIQDIAVKLKRPKPIKSKESIWTEEKWASKQIFDEEMSASNMKAG